MMESEALTARMCGIVTSKFDSYQIEVTHAPLEMTHKIQESGGRQNLVGVNSHFQSFVIELPLDVNLSPEHCCWSSETSKFERNFEEMWTFVYILYV